MMPELGSKGEGHPAISEMNPLPGDQQLRALPFSDWGEANLVEVLRYARGSKYLSMPLSWKEALPRAL